MKATSSDFNWAAFHGRRKLLKMAGLIMKLLGGAILWTVIAVVFFKWYFVEQQGGWDELKWRDVEREVRSGMSKR